MSLDGLEVTHTNEDNGIWLWCARCGDFFHPEDYWYPTIVELTAFANEHERRKHSELRAD